MRIIIDRDELARLVSLYIKTDHVRLVFFCAGGDGGAVVANGIEWVHGLKSFSFDFQFQQASIGSDRSARAPR